MEPRPSVSARFRVGFVALMICSCKGPAGLADAGPVPPPPILSIEILPALDRRTIAVGDAISLSTRTNTERAYTTEWSVVDTLVATIDPAGRLSVVGAGTTTIRAHLTFQGGGDGVGVADLEVPDR